MRDRSAALGRMALQATAYRLRCRVCGAEPTAAGEGLRCTMHPDAAIDEFTGQRVRTREVIVASQSTAGRAYRVLIGIDGTAVCTCMGWEAHGHCEHGRKALEDLMTTDPTMALVPIRVEPPRTILPSKQELEIIGILARSVVGARGHAVPAALDTPQKAAAVMIAGFELGVKPMTALRHFFVVNGKTEPDAQIMAGILQSREPDSSLTIVELTAERCTMRITRPARSLAAEYTYTIDDAKASGLIKPGNPWDKFPKDMLRWAVTKRLCRAYAPDLINAVGVEVNDDLTGDEGIPDAARVIDMADIPPGMLYSAGDEQPHVVDATTGEVDGGPPPLAAQVAEAMQAILGVDVPADTVVDGVEAWLAMYADNEGAAEAIAIAEAVRAELDNGAPSAALAIDKVHRLRAEAGRPFNVDCIIDPTVQPEAAAESAPAPRSRRGAAPQPGLGV